MNIYQKMSAITEEISAVAKNLSVGEGKSSYKAVGEADVLAAVKPIEHKHGVYSYPAKREIVWTDIMTTTSTYNGQTKETNKLCMRLKTTYRFVNLDEPSDYIEIETYGDGVDSQDKAPGKAMTYADKYALLKAYKIITGDDPDQNMSETGTFGKQFPKTASEKQIKELEKLYENHPNELAAWLKKLGTRWLEDVSYEEAQKQIDKIKKAKAARDA